jgi:tyrosine-protein phosphatase YwqE
MIGAPHTVTDRVDMWLSAWDNTVRGGDQLAHSLWSLASGGLAGMGLGQGSASLIPAGHADLIFSVLGEQLGFLGLLAMAGVYLLLVWRSMRIALRAEAAYSFFLVIGLTLVTALQVLLIAGGILGLAPLTGVVSPFLSFGRSSMAANFALFGIILAVSSRPAKDQRVHFGRTSRVLAIAASAAAVVILARAAWFQVIRADETLVRGALVVNADGARRYEYNPRLIQAARQIPRGDIYDRNGLPLATSDWAKVEAHAAEYNALGVDLEATLPRTTVSFAERAFAGTVRACGLRSKRISNGRKPAAGSSSTATVTARSRGAQRLAMLELAAESGTTDIVATPHGDDVFHFDYNAAREMVERLREVSGGHPRIHLGCELRLSYDNLAAALAEPKRYTIGGGSYLLVEFGEFVPPSAGEVLERLRTAGLTPVIAHPERNASLQRRPELLDEWAARNCVLQITAQSVTGELGRAAKDCSWRLIEAGLALVVASDGHDTSGRPPRLDQAREFISRKWSATRAQTLLETNPMAIVRDEALPLEPEPPEEPRKWYHFSKPRR